jgi:hypothetical protein
LGIINHRRKKKCEWKRKTMGDEEAGGERALEVETCERERVKEEMRRRV